MEKTINCVKHFFVKKCSLNTIVKNPDVLEKNRDDVKIVSIIAIRASYFREYLFTLSYSDFLKQWVDNKLRMSTIFECFKERDQNA